MSMLRRARLMAAARTTAVIPTPVTTPDPSVTAATIPIAPAKLALPDTATATVTAGDVPTLMTQLMQDNGTAIVLAPGTYDLGSSNNLFKRGYSQTKIIRSADINNPAIITRTSFNYHTVAQENFATLTNNMLFYGLTFQNGYERNLVYAFSNVQDVRFSRCTFDGSGSATAGDGTYTSYGAQFFGCARVQIDRCTFTKLLEGVFFQSDGTTRCTDCYRGFNDYTLISEDSGRYQGMVGLRAEWEYHGQYYVAVGIHSDSCQGAVSTEPNCDSGSPQFGLGTFSGTRHDGSGTLDWRSSDIRIQHCFFDLGRLSQFTTGTKLYAQGPFFVDCYTSTETYHRMQVWDNQIWFPGNQGIWFDNATDVDIQNNTLKRSSRADYSSNRASIQVTGCDRVAIKGNSYDLITTNSGSSGVSGINNLKNTGCTNITTTPNTQDTDTYDDNACITALNAWKVARVAAGL